MAKNTLTFSEIVHEGTVGGGDIGSRALLYVRLNAGETIRVAGEQEVFLVDKTDMTIIENLSGTEYTNDSGSTKEYFLAIDGEYASEKVVYDIITSEPIGAGFSQNPPANTVRVGGEDYPVDRTTEITPIVLNPGDGIELYRNFGGETPALFIYWIEGYAGDAIVEELSDVNNHMHIATKKEYVKIVALPHYQELSIQYRLFHHYEESRYIFVPGAAISGAVVESMALEIGDIIVNNTSETDLIIFDTVNMTTLASLAKDESYECSYRCDVMLFSNDASIEASYTKKDPHPNYEAEYEGDSGILQLRHAMGARVKVYGDAGAGYMLIHEMEGKEIVRCVNMSGFNSIKLVSDGEVDECIINEF